MWRSIARFIGGGLREVQLVAARNNDDGSGGRAISTKAERGALWCGTVEVGGCKVGGGVAMRDLDGT